MPTRWLVVSTLSTLVPAAFCNWMAVTESVGGLMAAAVMALLKICVCAVAPGVAPVASRTLPAVAMVEPGAIWMLCVMVTYQ